MKTEIEKLLSKASFNRSVKIRKASNNKEIKPKLLTDYEVKEIKKFTPAVHKTMMDALFTITLRPSELLATTRTNIDCENHSLQITRSLTDLEYDYYPAPRTIFFTDEQQTFFTSLLKNLDHDSEFIFINPDTNERWTNLEQFRRKVWKKILSAAGVEPRPLMYTRYYAAFKMLEQGYTDNCVAEQLGHPSIDYLLLLKK